MGVSRKMSELGNYVVTVSAPHIYINIQHASAYKGTQTHRHRHSVAINSFNHYIQNMNKKHSDFIHFWGTDIDTLRQKFVVVIVIILILIIVMMVDDAVNLIFSFFSFPLFLRGCFLRYLFHPGPLLLDAMTPLSGSPASPLLTSLYLSITPLPSLPVPNFLNNKPVSMNLRFGDVSFSSLHSKDEVGFVSSPLFFLLFSLSSFISIRL